MSRNDDDEADRQKRIAANRATLIEAEIEKLGLNRKDSGRYILQDRVPVPCDNLLEWGRWLEEHRAEQMVGHDHVGQYRVSTVFLALDFNWGLGPPLLFESIIFDDDQTFEDFRGRTQKGVTVWCRRTSTWELAQELHRAALLVAKLGKFDEDEDGGDESGGDDTETAT